MCGLCVWSLIWGVGKGKRGKVGGLEERAQAAAAGAARAFFASVEQRARPPVGERVPQREEREGRAHCTQQKTFTSLAAAGRPHSLRGGREVVEGRRGRGGVCLRHRRRGRPSRLLQLVDTLAQLVDAP